MNETGLTRFAMLIFLVILGTMVFTIWALTGKVSGEGVTVIGLLVACFAYDIYKFNKNN